MSNQNHPAGLGIYGDYLYFADTMSETIGKISIRQSRTKVQVIKRNIEGIIPLKVYHHRQSIGKLQ